MESANSDYRWVQIVLGVVLILLGLWTHMGTAVTRESKALFSDTQAYHNVAHSVLEGKGFDLDTANKGYSQGVPWIRKDGPTMSYAPIPTLYHIAYFGLGLDMEWMAIGNCTIFIAGVLAFYAMLLRILPISIAFLTSALLMTNHALVGSTSLHVLMTDWMFVTVSLLAMTAIILPKTAPRIVAGLIAGGLAAALIQIRGEGLFLAGAVFLAGLLRSDKSSFLRFSVAFVVMSACIMTPWIVRNYMVSGHFVPTRTTGAGVLYVAANENNPSIHSLALSYVGNSQPYPIEEVGSENLEYEASRKLSEASSKFMSDYTRIWIQACIIRSLYFWQPYNWFEGIESLVWRIAMVALSIFGLTQFPWRDRRAYALLAPVVAYGATSFLVGGDMLTRLRSMMSPADALFIALGAVGIVRTAVLMVKGPRTTGVIASAVAALLVAVSIGGTAWYVNTTPGRGELVYQETFEDSNALFKYERICRTKDSNEVTLARLSDGNSVLRLNGAEYPRNWKGIEYIMRPKDYTLNQEYALDFYVYIPSGSRGMVRVTTVDNSKKPLMEHAHLSDHHFANEDSDAEWRRERIRFRAPYKKGLVIVVSFLLGDDSLARDRETGMRDFSTHELYIDNIEVFESSFGRRLLEEYFAPSTWRDESHFYGNAD